MYFDLNKKITFLLLIKERREFTLRFFNYLAITNFPFKIFIADGSKHKIKQKYLNILKKHKINFEYKKFTYDSTYAIYNKKILNSLKLIKTEYVQLFSDDDFPVIINHYKLIQFLEKNRFYNSCGGYAVNFQILKNLLKKNETYGHPCNFSKILFNDSNDNKDKTKRLEYYLNHFQSSWHNLWRTKILLKNYRTVNQQKIIFSNINFYDYLQDATNYISGKTKKFHILQFLHQHHNKNEINKRLTKEENIKYKSYNSDLNKFITIINKILFKKKNIKKIIIKSKLFSFNKKFKNKINSHRFKNFYIYKISNQKFLLLYNLFLNIIFYVRNKHLQKLMILIKNVKIKKELKIIFNFLKNMNYLL
jgi:glycosyltransferase domain-containing protein